EIEAGVVETFGFASAITIRTRDELAQIVAGNPPADVMDDDRRLQGMFLSHAPHPALPAAVHRAAVPPPAVALLGPELYVWTPDGISVAELYRSALNEKRLGVRATARNWRTVQKLLAMADAD